MEFQFKNLKRISKNLTKAEELVKKSVKSVYNDIGAEVAQKTKKNLREQNFSNWSSHHNDSLSKSTIKSRKQGVYWGGKRVPPTNRKRALIQTGTLLNSIKWYKSKNELRMAKHGIHHEEGFPNFNANMTVMRKFIHRPNLKLQEKGIFYKVMKPLKKIFGQ